MAITDNNVKWKVKKIGVGEISVMQGATATENGEGGLVPGPTAGKQASFLRGDGTWNTPTLTSLGVTATAAELNYVDGVTSNVQTQLNAKAPTASPTFTGTVTAPTVTVSTTLNIPGGKIWIA